MAVRALNKHNTRFSTEHQYNDTIDRHTMDHEGGILRDKWFEMLIKILHACLLITSYKIEVRSCVIVELHECRIILQREVVVGHMILTPCVGASTAAK